MQDSDSKKESMADDIESQYKNQEKNSTIDTQSRQIMLKFENVVYKIKVTTKHGKLFNKTTQTSERPILNGISGVVNPGEMLAMLGPSGSGKTTLLTALGGRLGGRLAGLITYNDKPYTNSLKRSIGFVTQDDILYANLTVTETLVYTALLRLPNTLTREQKIQQAEDVITELNLTRCRGSIIGGPFSRGVSGGERKRVSIGQEMLVNPSLLFLDEPTSGLDSTTAQTIVWTLSLLAKRGKTVVMTIHQPSSKLFYMFDKVLLLADGSPLYFGKGDEVMEYFNGVGFAPSRPMNPADFLLDLANGISSDETVEDQALVKSTLMEAYKNNLGAKVKQEMDECSGSEHLKYDHHQAGTKEEPKWMTTWSEQFWILMKRGFKERRHECFSKVRIIQVFALAFLSGLLWWKSTDLGDQVGLLFFYTGFWGFFPLFQAIFTFPPERQMLAKERSSGMYRLSSYFIARIISDIPMELALPTSYTTIVYLMAGLKLNFISFIYNLFSLLFSNLVSQGLGLALGAVFLDQKDATVLGSVLMLGFQLAGGYYVQHVPVFIGWIKYLSIMQYTFKLLLCSQYSNDETYQCATGVCMVRDLPTIKTVGLTSPLFAAAMLFVMLVFYRVVAYVALMRIGAPPK